MLQDTNTPEVSQLKRIAKLTLFNNHELASLANKLEVLGHRMVKNNRLW
jgi:hypothetical protein